MARLAGNSPSSSDDSFGRSNDSAPARSSSVPHSLTLAELLRAAIDNKVDPSQVYSFLPTNIATMFDEASRHAAQVGFLELSPDGQRNLFVAFLNAASAPQLNDMAPSTVTTSEKRPWWKFW